jgi:CMP-N-acetylneuraminic acid synthetase
MKKILTIIPARGGSKGIPRKNITEVGGHPLIYYTIKSALQVSELEDIVVSTEDSEIASISQKIGAQVPFMRPKSLATDEAQSAPVVIHALKKMEEINETQYDAVLMLQPTSPLRTSKNIRDALKLFYSQKCNSVVSLVSVGGVHPFRMKRLVGKQLVNYIDQGFWDMRPRQELPPVYIRNGSIYLINRDALIKGEQLISDKCLGMLMSDEESINIDSPIDLKLAKLILQERG